MHYHLKNLEIQASIGVYESEKKALQKVLVSVEFDFNSTKASESDNLEDTIDYAQLEQLIRSVCEEQHYQLLEKLYAVLQQKISKAFPHLENLEIRLEKFPFKNGSIVVA